MWYTSEELVAIGLAHSSLLIDASHRPNIPLTPELARLLDERGGTAGFTADDPPPDLPVLPGYDAFILSTDNAMAGEP